MRLWVHRGRRGGKGTDRGRNSARRDTWGDDSGITKSCEGYNGSLEAQKERTMV